MRELFQKPKGPHKRNPNTIRPSQRSMRRRLLHHGANTTQIIDVYIAAIKVID